jgi:GGDEF domain-containing protein
VDDDEGGAISITASVGLAGTDGMPGERDEDAVLAAADLAMYRAKRGGRDGYALHDVADGA